MMILSLEDLVKDFDIQKEIIEKNKSNLYKFLDSERKLNWQNNEIKKQLEAEIIIG